MGLRDAIQRMALENRHYGDRRIAALLGREGWKANHKRVLRLMREDNFLCLRKRALMISLGSVRVVGSLSGAYSHLRVRARE
jgi:transposase InsO family protein